MHAAMLAASRDEGTAAAGAPPRKDDEKAHHELYVGLRNWLCREDGGVYPPDTDLLQEIMNHGLQCWTRPKTISADDATARFGTDRRVGRVRIVTADQRATETRRRWRRAPASHPPRPDVPGWRSAPIWWPGGRR